MGVWRDDVRSALIALGGVGSLEEIYKQVQRIRVEPLPTSWRAIIRRELEHNSSDSEAFQQRHDWFYSVNKIGSGVWGLREFEASLPEARDLVEASPERALTHVFRILRDTKLARNLKRLHGDRCQLCGLALKFGPHGTYSEAHHIKPLGSPHNGPDTASNVIVVCPNHHALLDYRAITLSKNGLRLHPDHKLDDEYIEYHNTQIPQLK